MKGKAIVYKLISCCVFIIIICVFFVGSLSFAQGLDSIPSGWEKIHKEAVKEKRQKYFWEFWKWDDKSSGDRNVHNNK